MTWAPRETKRHYHFTELSERPCEVEVCTTRIKQRMVDIRDAKVCYRCHIATKDYGVRP